MQTMHVEHRPLKTSDMHFIFIRVVTILFCPKTAYSSIRKMYIAMTFMSYGHDIVFKMPQVRCDINVSHAERDIIILYSFSKC